MFQKVNIVLADSQPLYREGIKTMLKDEGDLEIVAEAKDTAELIPKLKLFTPQILILDYNPKYFDSNGLLSWLKANTSCRVVILSSQEKKWDIIKSLQLNVFAYLTKESTKEEILRGLRSTAKGEKYFCSYVLNVLMEQNNADEEPKDLKQIQHLTERELEITKLVAAGKKNKEIAEELSISPHTIHTHRKNILKKLGVSSALELSIYVKKAGIID